MSMVKPIPDGYCSATPYLIMKNADRGIRFYQEAFDAHELFRMPTPDGKGILHAEIKIGDSVIMVSDEFGDRTARSPESLGGTSAGVMLYVEDVDAVWKKALAVGGQAKMPPTDRFLGDRYCKVIDPCGHEWASATHVEDVPPEEIGKRTQAFFAQMTPQ
jgi:PhnB protein